ncbi:MAG: T9SS type A sorting domain-containing protein [Bacteroidota bacterium]
MYFSTELLLIVFVLFVQPLQGQDFPIFEEVNGLVVIEAESAFEYGNWENETSIGGYTGESYLHYKGPNLYNTVGLSKLTFKINISTIGTYRFQWRSRIAQGTENTEHNDSWMRIKGAAKFYAKKDSSILHPGGSGLTPNPNGSSIGGYFKVYQNNLGSWTWQTRTSDHDPHGIFVEFDSIGTYTVEICGRSKGHAIDRIILYEESISYLEAQNLDNAESIISNLVSTKDLQIIPLKIMPNPVNDLIFIQPPKNTSKAIYSIRIFDSIGKLWYDLDKAFLPYNRLEILVRNIPPGIYWIHLKSQGQFFQGKFIKK